MLDLVVINQTKGILETNISELELFVASKLESYNPELYEGDAESAKKDRAELNKSKTALSSARKELIKELMQPYSDFESRCKKLEKDIDVASSKLDEIVKVKENAEKTAKKIRCEELWLSKNFTLFPMDKIFNQKWLNKTTKDSEINAEMDAIIEKVYSELKLIERFAEDSDTLKSIYLDNLDIGYTLDYGEELKKNREKIAEEKATRDEREVKVQFNQVQQDIRESAKNVDVDNLVNDILGVEEIKKEFSFVIKATDNQVLDLRNYLASKGILVESLDEITF